MLRALLVGLLAIVASTTRAQEAVPPGPPETRLAVAILPIVSTDVDPIVPRRVADTLITTAGELGYDVVGENALVRALASVRVSTEPTPAEVWRVTVLAGAQRGIAVRIGVADGNYVAELFIASADGAGPFRATIRGDGSTFLANVAQTLRDTLPAPSSFDATAASRYSLGLESAPPRPAAAGWSTATYSRGPTGRAPVPQTRYGFTVVSESAFGRAQGSRYYHHILGARMDFTVGQNVVVGLFAGYVNFDLGSSRASNLLFYAQLEDRLQFVATGRARFPLRIGFGYVPFNGPFLRFSAGLRFPAGDRFELGFDLLAPTFWWVPGDRRVTYDVGAELTYRFGPSR